MGDQKVGGKVQLPLKKNEKGFGVPKIKGRIHYDEKYVKVKDHFEFRLAAIDNKTKFTLSEDVVVERTINACISFLGVIRSWCYAQILDQYLKERHKPVAKRHLIIFVSDKFANYKNAFNKLFYRVAKLRFGVPIACKKYGLEHNNNPIERYNKETGRRVDALGVFQTHEGALSTLTLCRFIYNYVTPHSSLGGKTPAEAAGLKLQLGDNKLLDLIRIARKIEMTRS
jgi:transposase-like protein